MLDLWKYSVNKIHNTRKPFSRTVIHAELLTQDVKKFLNQLKLRIREKEKEILANYSESIYIRKHLVSRGE